MVKVVKYGIIGFMVIAALVVGFMAFGWYTIDAPTSDNDKKAKVEKEVQSVDKEIEPVPKEEYVPAAENMIAKEHRIMNELVGFDNEYEFDFEYQKDELTMVRDEMQQQAEHADDENMKADFENIVKLIDLGLKNKDVESIVYAHRIVHDLDMKVNGYVGSATDVHRYGYSKYDNGEQASNVDYKLQDAQ